MEDTDLEGRVLAGRYRIDRRIASGGMATLWRATDQVLGRGVAVKVLRPEVAQDGEVLERFRREAVAAARLSHPAVVRVFDTGTSEGTAYIVMELLEGTTLADVIRDRGPLPPAEAAEITRTVLRGLTHAHRAGVIHRDVKPGNILMDGNALVKVTDFGIAKAAFPGGDLTATGTLLGTARYLAPEQVAGEPVDQRTDVYATGIILYELLTGRPPFQAEGNLATATERLDRDPTPPGALRPGIPGDLEAVVMKALARDPERRYRTAEEMAAALDRVELAAPRVAAAPRPEAPPPHRGSAFRSWVLVPILLAVVAALAVGGWMVFQRLQEEGGTPQPGQGGPPPAEPLEIQDAFDFDPLGDDRESPDSVDLSFDGDSSTAWQTEGYDSEDLGNLKPGVGIAYDLGDELQISEVRIDTPYPGWTFELYASTDWSHEAPSEEPAAASDGSVTFTSQADQVIELEPVEARYILVWITRVAPTEDRNRGGISEIEFLGG